MLEGRAHDQARLDTLLSGAREGRSAVLVIRGEPGIGKTSLLAYAGERARDMAVLRGTGIETEAEIPFSSLHLLLRPVLARVDTLPERQAAALSGALGIGPAGRDDEFLVGLAVLSLLSDLADDGPLLCLVDDAHWLDRASAAALRFAAHRLHAEGVVLLFGARDGFDAAGLPEHLLGGLDRESSERLLTGRAPGLAAPMRERIIEESGGNPLALLELQESAPAQGPLPLPRRIQEAYAARIARLPADAATVLVLAAVEDGGELPVIVRAAAELGVAPAALDTAERSGLIRIDGAHVTFAHPLMRAAAFRHGTYAARLEMHRVLARLLGGRPDRQAWHLAAAATGPDETAALALEQAAERARERSGNAGASAALERAAELTEETAVRARRLTSAAVAAADAGQPGRAKDLIDRAGHLLTDPRSLARLSELRARVAFDEGAPHLAHDLLLSGADLIVGQRVTGRRAAGDAVTGDTATGEMAAGDAADGDMADGGGIAAADRVMAGLMLIDAARNAWQLSDPGRVAEAAGRLHALGLQPEDGLGPAVDAVTGAAEFLAKGPAGALATMRGLVADGGRIREGAHALRVNAAFVAGLVGDFQAGRDISAAVAAECRARGDIGKLPLALLTLTACDLYLGRFNDAVAGAAEGLRLAADTGQPNRAGYLEGMLAWIAAVRGEDAECSRLATRCLDRFEANRIANGPAWAEWALALLELGRGRFAEALDRLDAALEGPVRHQIQAVYFAPDQIEAAVRLGAPAGEPLRRFEEWADAAGHDWAGGVLHRCRALLEPDWDTAHEHFRAAVRLHADSGRPWEAARTRLAFGERLRRERHKGSARPHLRAALETFERLGARPWAERARTELRAAGDTSAPAGHDEAVSALSPQELQIVRLAAAGLTNREIGAQLFLSPKTVSYHLYRAFPKLNVASRAQLAGLDLS
ncbi:LuxR C-terminal-related transcriptional regulator [Nonomuraea sp. 3-1Str]|uniref:LuxR C-terminal-related transcriptional regulator n=1 Tax=Nonomuraea sp. 3-1Str TaxID=2929801 RepID=UPI00285EB66B|nr:AAA family ATPase [Nonomuraea sp. 3-1Str]MDR8408094.1 LuxR C-terminal-related transcriptional regulator [Nonomuraea sp. 3-1Str]